MANSEQQETQTDKDQARYFWEECKKAVDGQWFNDGWGPDSFRNLDPYGFDEDRAASLFDPIR